MLDYGTMTDRELLHLIAEKVERLTKTVESLDDARMLELTQCVFHPARQQNGNSVLARLRSLEDSVLKAKWFMAGLTAVNIGSIANVGALVKDYLLK